MMKTGAIFLFCLAVGWTSGSMIALPQSGAEATGAPPVPPQDPIPQDEANRDRLMEIAKKMNETVKAEIMQEMKVREGLVDRAVRTNFLNTLFLMANASAVTGAQVSRAAGTIIRGFVQDSFSLVSIGAYLPRLIFLDGPTQFIEILRLVRTNQLQIPRDVDEAMDTLINFADVVRTSQISGNLATPFLSFFPNVFRGAELLSTELLYGVFSWLGPISPVDISSASVEGLWNRWDMKSSTTARTVDRRTKPAEFK